MRPSASPTPVCSARSRSSNASNSFFRPREGLHVPAHRLEQRGRVLRQLRRFALRLVPRLAGGFELRAASPASASRCGRPFLRPWPPASCPRSACAICTSIAQTISFTRLAWTTACSTACCWLSSALALLRDVLGEGVERREALLGALAQLVEPRQRPELALDVLDGGHRRGRVLARFARRLADLAVILRQRRRRRAHLIELAS